MGYLRTVQVTGEVLGGRYRLGPVLGQGGMAVVHSAEDMRLGRRVAVKLLLPSLSRDAEVRQRFEEEARSAARVSHPNIVTVFDWGEEKKQPYLVMECIDGPTLADEIRTGPLPAPRVRELAMHVLGALAAAHKCGLLHRDVKPANIVLGSDGRWMVADFGIAKSMEATATDLTSRGMVIGTAAYMAPERLRGEPATPESDLYAVGVIIDEALANPQDDPALADAARRAMSRDPAHRFASADEMASAISSPPTLAMTAVTPASQRTVAMPTRPRDPTVATAVPARGWWADRAAVVATCVVGAIMLIAVAVGAAMILMNDDSPPASETPSAQIPDPLGRSIDELDRVVEP